MLDEICSDLLYGEFLVMSNQIDGMNLFLSLAQTINACIKYQCQKTTYVMNIKTSEELPNQLTMYELYL